MKTLFYVLALTPLVMSAAAKAENLPNPGIVTSAGPEIFPFPEESAQQSPSETKPGKAGPDHIASAPEFGSRDRHPMDSAS